ncbi:MAG: ABC transporter permease [Lachnospiraceae bacterium]|nr:ABC transporter permease [Lachnospiraceae bacterium]
MKILLKNEFLKITRSKAFRIAFLLSLIYVPFNILTGGSAEYFQYGYRCPVVIYGFFETCFFWIFGAIIAALVAGEYDNGTIRNVIGLGIDRRKYFISKVISVFTASAFILFLMVFAFFVVATIRFTRWTGFVFTGKYLLKLLSYYITMLVFVLSYESIFILFSQIFHSTRNTFLGVLGITLLENEVAAYLTVKALGRVTGPIGTIMKIRAFYDKGAALDAAFWLNLIPSVVVGIAAIVASYFLFIKKDIE